MELKTLNIYEFGPFRLEPGEHRLLRAGQQIPLTPKGFELLLLLIENHGRLVFKNQIMHAVWPGSFVEEANLTVSMSALRKALGKTDDGLQYIETVPKKGYRFAVSVRELKPSETARPQPDSLASPPSAMPRLQAIVSLASSGETRHSNLRRVAILAGLVCVAIAGYFMYRIYRTNSGLPRAASMPHRLAILPLRNLRHDSVNDFLGFSLADAVITKLDSINSLTVRPSSAIEKYKGQAIDVSKVAAELNVDTLLIGSFIREGDRLRITYQLIEAKTNKILGRDVIDVNFDKLLMVQDNVARQIIKELALKLSPSEARQITLDDTVAPLAYEYYLRGVDLMGNHNFPLAIKMLEKCTEIDPNYALAWAYLGQSHTSFAAFEFGGIEEYRKARSAYERALSLHPNQPEATMFLANLLIDTGKVEEAVPLLRDAIDRNPNHAAVHWELGYAYRFAGALQESLAECELARRLDPAVRANGALLNTYLYLGEYDKFLRSLPEVDDSPFLLFYRGFGEYHRKNWPRAAADFDRAYQLDPTLYTQIGKSLSDSIGHRRPNGLEILESLENRIRQGGVGDPEATYKMAQAYAALSEKGGAIRMLEYSIRNGFFCYPYFLKDPLLNEIRNDSRFSEQMSAAKRRYEAFRARFF